MHIRCAVLARLLFLAFAIMVVDANASVVQTAFDTSAMKRQLEEIANRDQGPRRSGDASQTLINDSLDLVQICAIIDKFGWLGKSVVGQNGNRTLWLVLQHADRDPAIQKKYLPLLARSVADSQSYPMDLAYLQDRILKNDGQKQVYGSQAWVNPTSNLLEIWPIEDIVHVNSRRSSVGLMAIEDYAKMLDAVYPPS
jgi:hypothetical protein